MVHLLARVTKVQETDASCGRDMTRMRVFRQTVANRALGWQ